MVFAYIIWFIVACLVLIGSSTLVVRNLVKIAAYHRLKDFVVGFLVMAIATSVPELLVGLNAAFKGVPSLSLGDVLGSNIADLALIIGIIALISGRIKVDSKTARTNSLYIFAIASLPLLFLFDGILKRWEGIVLLIIFVLFMVKLYRQRTAFSKKVNAIKKKEYINSIFWFIFGVALLILSAKFVVSYAILIAVELSLPLIFIGILAVALGTSLPELVFELKAIKSGVSNMAWGDIMGSVVVNSTLVLGIVAVISPIAVANYTMFMIAAVFLLFSLILFIYVVKVKEEINWKHGIVFLLIYVVFIIVESLAKNQALF
jgi:cation:H+ antiporter